MNALANKQTKVNSITSLRTTLGFFPTGVTVVTTNDSNSKPIGLTVNSFNSLSLDPPLILWSLNRNSIHLNEYLNASGFAINILSANQKNICQKFSKNVKDRFEGVDWSYSKTGLPVLSNAAALLECENTSNHDGGDHVIFIGRVVNHCHSELDPMIFVKGQFTTCSSEPPVARHWG